MVNFTKTSYFNIRDYAWSFLIDSETSVLPLDLYEIASKNNWNIIQVEEHLVLAALLDKNNYCETCAGWSCVYNGEPLIFYRHAENIGRQRFTIAHEFGHVVLRHLTALDDATLEREANMFAARILMPLCVLKECKALSAARITELCNVSLTAATYRAERLAELLTRNKFYTSKKETVLLKQFTDFIQKYNNT